MRTVVLWVVGIAVTLFIMGMIVPQTRAALLDALAQIIDAIRDDANGPGARP